MSWSTSNRRSRLPSNWSDLRRKILRRDNHLCQLRWMGCSRRATEVDHIRRGDDHRPENLQAVCTKCHAKKSALEGRQAQRTNRKKVPRHEAHPGLRPKPRGGGPDARTGTQAVGPEGPPQQG